jgi:exodeoxyribonuclease VII large subunit
MREILEERRTTLAQLGAQIAALSPLAVLDRGYAMVRADDGAIVRDASKISKKDRLHITLASGSLEVLVEKILKAGDK